MVATRLRFLLISVFLSSLLGHSSVALDVDLTGGRLAKFIKVVFVEAPLIVGATTYVGRFQSPPAKDLTKFQFAVCTAPASIERTCFVSQ